MRQAIRQSSEGSARREPRQVVGGGATAASALGGGVAPVRGRRLGWLALALSLAAFAYFPITANFFRGDDFLHLYRIVNKDPREFILFMQGGHLLMTRNVAFVLFFHAFGTDVSAYFWVVLATHLVNVFLLFRIIGDLSGSARLACFGAALWGTLPVQEGALGWYSVYGHVMVATCTLLVLAGLARAAIGRPPAAAAPWLWALLLLGGATSFGVGIGVALAMPLVVLLLLPPSPLRHRLLLAFCSLALALPVIYFGSERLYGYLYGSRVSTETAAALLLTPRPYALLVQLMGYGISCVVLGVFAGPSSFPGAIGYTAIAVYAIALMLALARGDAPLRRRILAFLAIAAGAYALVATGRSTLAGIVGIAAMAREVRLHYVATAGLVVAGCLALSRLVRVWPWNPAAGAAAVLLWAAATAVGGRVLGTPIAHFDTARRETERVVKQIRRVAQAAPPASDVYIENQRFASVGPMIAKTRAKFPGLAALYTIYFPGEHVAGRRIWFVEEDRQALAATRTDRRTAAVLVAPEDAPATVHRLPQLRRGQ